LVNGLHVKIEDAHIYSLNEEDWNNAH